MTPITSTTTALYAFPKSQKQTEKNTSSENDKSATYSKIVETTNTYKLSDAITDAQIIFDTLKKHNAITAEDIQIIAQPKVLFSKPTIINEKIEVAITEKEEKTNITHFIPMWGNILETVSKHFAEEYGKRGISVEDQKRYNLRAVVLVMEDNPDLNINKMSNGDLFQLYNPLDRLFITKTITPKEMSAMKSGGFNTINN